MSTTAIDKIKAQIKAAIDAYMKGEPTMTREQFDELMLKDPQCRILEEVAEERDRQDAKWGEQNHDPFKWLCILGEEVGEACRAAYEADGYDGFRNLDAYRTELIQVAAVAVSMIECLDRGKW